MNFGERLKEIRLQRGKTLMEVAEKLGKTEATVQRYESGNIKNPKADTIQELADVYNVSPAYLMGWEGDKTEIIKESSYQYVTAPVSAGLPENIDAIDDCGSIKLPDSIMGKWAGSDVFVTKVNGESMNKTIPHGSLIAVKYIDPCNLKDGDIVLYSDDHEYAVKRFYKHGDKIIFRPNSNDLRFTDYVTDINNSNLKIHGKVVLYIVELD